MEALAESGLGRRRARPHDDRAGRRAGRRRAVGGAGPARGGGPRGHPAGRLAGRARHGQLRAARDRARARSRAAALHVHNPTVTLMRTTRRGERASSAGGSPRSSTRARSPTVLFSRCGGVSAIDVAGSRSTTPRRTRRCSTRCASRLDPTAWRSSRGRRRHQRPGVRRPRLARPPARAASRRRDDQATRRWRGCAAQVADGQPIIGGGAGTGLSAKCAEAGGVDLIIIYNSGRYRMAGRGSLAGLMPYGDANAIVMDMAREVLPVVERHAGAGRRLRHRSVPADAALPGGASRRPASRRAELPDRRPDRRHVPRRASRRPGWATTSRSR